MCFSHCVAGRHSGIRKKPPRNLAAPDFAGGITFNDVHSAVSRSSEALGIDHPNPALASHTKQADCGIPAGTSCFSKRFNAKAD